MVSSSFVTKSVFREFRAHGGGGGGVPPQNDDVISEQPLIGEEVEAKVDKYGTGHIRVQLVHF